MWLAANPSKPLYALRPESYGLRRSQLLSIAASLEQDWDDRLVDSLSDLQETVTQSLQSIGNQPDSTCEDPWTTPGCEFLSCNEPIIYRSRVSNDNNVVVIQTYGMEITALMHAGCRTVPLRTMSSSKTPPKSSILKRQARGLANKLRMKGNYQYTTPNSLVKRRYAPITKT